MERIRARAELGPGGARPAAPREQRNRPSRVRVVGKGSGRAQGLTSLRATEEHRLLAQRNITTSHELRGYKHLGRPTALQDDPARTDLASLDNTTSDGIEASGDSISASNQYCQRQGSYDAARHAKRSPHQLLSRQRMLARPTTPTRTSAPLIA